MDGTENFSFGYHHQQDPRFKFFEDGDREWVNFAKCNGHPELTDMFIPPTNGIQSQERIDLETNAKQYCIDCKVAVACLAYAIKHKEQGVWGGKTDEERRLIMRTKETAS